MTMIIKQRMKAY